MSEKNRPTLKTIAEATGLAVTTVSRALSGAPEIALKTRQRVAAVAEEMGYTPDRAAQRLRTGKTKVITLMLSPHPESLGFGNSLMIGLGRALEGSGYHLNITPCLNKSDELSPIKDNVRNHLSDGIIFTRTEPFDDRIRYLLDVNHPFITYGRSEFSEPHNFVDYDYERFAYQAVKQLAHKSCRKIGLILPPSNLMNSQLLRTGFMKGIKECGVDFEIPERIHTESKSYEIRSWAKSRVMSANCPDSFICPGESAYLAINSGIRDQIPTTRSKPQHQFVVRATSGIIDQLSTPVDQISEDIEFAGESLGRLLLESLGNPRQAYNQKITSPIPKFT